MDISMGWWDSFLSWLQREFRWSIYLSPQSDSNRWPIYLIPLPDSNRFIFLLQGNAPLLIWAFTPKEYELFIQAHAPRECSLSQSRVYPICSVWADFGFSTTIEFLFEHWYSDWIFSIISVSAHCSNPIWVNFRLVRHEGFFLQHWYSDWIFSIISVFE